MIETRTLPGKHAQLRVMQTDAGRTLSGYAVVWDSYSRNLGGFVEVARRGVFDKALSSGADVVVTLNHDMSELLGRSGVGGTTITSDQTGLRYDVPLGSDPTAAKVGDWVERGLLKGSSFIFQIPVEGVTWSRTDQGYPLRELVADARLYDVGPATIPAYGATEDAGALALRSLAECRGLDLQLVMDAAARNELAAILDGEPRTVAPGSPGAPASSRDLARMRRRLRLAEALVPVR